MPLVDLATAKMHLRVTHDSEDTLIEAFVASAQEQAQAFLNRNLYAGESDLAGAIAAAPEALAAASVAYDAAMEAAGALENGTEAALNYRAARDAYSAAIEEWRRTVYGMVANESVRTGVLLITASLWEHRGDEDAVVGIPQAARTFLWPWRIGLGV